MQDTDKITNLNKHNIMIKFCNIERWCWTHHLQLLAKIIWRIIYCAVVTKDVPPLAVVACVPANVIGYRKDCMQYKLKPFNPNKYDLEWQKMLNIEDLI